MTKDSRPLNEQLDNIEDNVAPAPKLKRMLGFAAMDVEKRRAIAALGGAAVKPHQRAFNNKELASSAGRKGGARGHGGGRPKKVADDT